MPDVDRVARRRYRRIVGRAVFLAGLVCLGFLFPVPIVFTAFVCPAIALAVAVTAAGRLGPWCDSPDAARFLEWTTRALAYAGVPNAVLVLAICANQFTRNSDPGLRGFTDWLWVAALLVPQLFWFPRLRANRWVALALALASLAASAEFWYELRTSPKW